jgi:hypothetical protein
MDHRIIVFFLSSSLRIDMRVLFAGIRLIEQPDGIFAIVLAKSAEFI